MEEYLLLLIHHGDSFLDNELNVYEGGIIIELRIDVDKWSYFKFVGIVKELGIREIYII